MYVMWFACVCLCVCFCVNDVVFYSVLGQRLSFWVCGLDKVLYEGSERLGVGCIWESYLSGVWLSVCVCVCVCGVGGGALSLSINPSRYLR